MNTKSMRISVSLIVMMALIFGGMPMGFAAANYGVTKVTTNPLSSIYENTPFYLELTFDKYSGPDLDLTLVNTDTSSFVLQSMSTHALVSSIKIDKADDNDHKIAKGDKLRIPLIYRGKGTEFSFNLISNLDGSVVYSSSVLISAAVPTDNTPPAPPTERDPSKYEPKFSLVNNAVLGEYTTVRAHDINIGLKNTTSHQAKNLSISLEKGDDALPFVINSSTLNASIAQVLGSKTENASFKFSINPAAAPKTYALQLKISYENVFGDKFTQLVPVYVKVINNALEPIVTVVDQKIIGGPLNETTSATLELMVKNGGSLLAQRATIQLEGFSANGVRLIQDVDTKLIGSIGQNMRGIVKYTIMAAPGAKGPQTLTAVIKYYDIMGQEYVRKEEIYLDVPNQTGSTKGIDLTFDKRTYTLSPTKAQSITVKVKNSSAEVKKDLKLTISSDAGLKFLTPYVSFIEELKAGEEFSFTYQAVLGSGVTSNTYPLYATVVPVAGEEGDQRIQVAGVYVPDAEDGATSKPKIIIDSYEFGGEHILAGETFELIVRFQNTSRSMGIQNAKVVMSADDNIFIPVDSANSFFIPKIGTGETVEHRMTLRTKADAKVQMYGVTYKIEYEDQNGKSYDEKSNPFIAEERIAVSVKQEIRLEVSDMFFPPESQVGMPVPVEVEFFNMGKAPMYNLMVKLEGNFQAQNSNYFVGNFDAARSDYFSGVIMPMEPGELLGRLVFIFEDETGVKQEIEYPISMMITEGGDWGGGEEIPPDWGGEEPFPEPEKPGFNLPLWAWATIVLVPAGVGGALFMRRRKKAQLASLLEEPDED